MQFGMQKDQWKPLRPPAMHLELVHITYYVLEYGKSFRRGTWTRLRSPHLGQVTLHVLNQQLSQYAGNPLQGTMSAYRHRDGLGLHIAFQQRQEADLARHDLGAHVEFGGQRHMAALADQILYQLQGTRGQWGHGIFKQGTMPPLQIAPYRQRSALHDQGPLCYLAQTGPGLCSQGMVTRRLHGRPCTARKSGLA